MVDVRGSRNFILNSPYIRRLERKFFRSSFPVTGESVSLESWGLVGVCVSEWVLSCVWWCVSG